MASNAAEWTGPTVGEMIRTHTLAENVIMHHNEPCPVFDASELRILKAFVQNPAARDQILRENDMVELAQVRESTQASQRSTAKTPHSLAGYLVARHRLGNESKHEQALTDEEIEQLRLWFESGAVDERLKQD